jgi:hypothetical protein
VRCSFFVDFFRLRFGSEAADGKGDGLTAEEDMAQMSQKFLDLGANVYVDAKKVKKSDSAL